MCSVPTLARPASLASRDPVMTALFALAVKFSSRPAMSPSVRSNFAVSRIAVTLRTAASSARWQIGDTGRPASLTASASSSDR